MKRAIAAAAAIFVSIQAPGSEVWVTFSQLSSKGKLETLAEERRQQLKDADFVSSFDALIRRPVGENILKPLFKIEVEAQNAFTDGQFKKSLALYKSLINKLESLPNVSGVERITFATFIHTAELHDLLDDGEGAQAWRQAHAWDSRHLRSGPEFSPKITEKFNALKLKPDLATLEIVCPLDSAVYVDGKKVSARDGRFQKSLESGYHHVDVLTPGSDWMSKSVELTSKAEKEMTFRPEPLVEGSCDDPHFVGTPLPPKTKLLVDFGNCDRIYFEKTWFTREGRRLEALAPAPGVTSSGSVAMSSTGTLPTLSSRDFDEPGEKSWITESIHSKWFWVGLGVVAVGALAISAQSQQVLTPTNTYK